jgi:hypothetical protein
MSLLDSILNGKADDFIEGFKEAMVQKVEEVIEDEKVEVARNMFSYQKDEQE